MKNIGVKVLLSGWNNETDLSWSSSLKISAYIILLTARASLRFGKYRWNMDSFRGFIENFSLFLNRSEALLTAWKLTLVTFHLHHSCVGRMKCTHKGRGIGAACGRAPKQQSGLPESLLGGMRRKFRWTNHEPNNLKLQTNKCSDKGFVMVRKRPNNDQSFPRI